jgi:hypothetical protein
VAPLEATREKLHPTIAGKETNHRRPAPTAAAQGTKTPAMTTDQQFTVNAYESLLRTLRPGASRYSDSSSRTGTPFRLKHNPLSTNSLIYPQNIPRQLAHTSNCKSVIHGLFKKKPA